MRLSATGRQADIEAAIQEGRDDLIRALATHRTLPTVVERSSSADSSPLGKRTVPTIRFDAQSGETGGFDRQTSVLVVDGLRIDTPEDCEAVREEIQNHPAGSST